MLALYDWKLFSVLCDLRMSQMYPIFWPWISTESAINIEYCITHNILFHNQRNLNEYVFRIYQSPISCLLFIHLFMYIIYFLEWNLNDQFSGWETVPHGIPFCLNCSVWVILAVILHQQESIHIKAGSFISKQCHQLPELPPVISWCSFLCCQLQDHTIVYRFSNNWNL